MAQDPNTVYDAYYYQTGCGRPYQRDEQWLGFFNMIAERIVQEIQPKTVFDAGCAMGFLVESLRARGVEAYGMDISEYAISSVHPSIQPYCRVGSIADPFPQMYDLIVTIEVLEHIPQFEAEKVVANICRHTSDVLFSSGTEDLREVTHLNLHPPEYWAALFAQQGFYRDVDFDGTFLTPWTVRFRRMNEPAHRIIMGYERKIDFLIRENAAVRQVNLEQRNALAAKDQEVISLKNQLMQRDQETIALKNQLMQRDEETVSLDARLSAVVNSRTYRIAQRLRSLVPQGSRREKWGVKVWQMISKRGR